jgi:hypothetical protein
MDQGVAGLLGAAVGGAIGVIGTISAAWLTGRGQRRSQHEQWLRQVRRDAYVRFVGCLHRVDRDVALAEAALFSEGEQAPDFWPESVNEAGDALTAVLLEGPDEIYELALQVFHHVQAWLSAIRNARSEPPEARHEAWDPPGMDIGYAIDQFTLAASRILRDPNQGLRPASAREVSPP